MNRPYSPARTPTFWLLLVSVAVVGLAAAILFAVIVSLTPRSALVGLPLVAGYAVANLAVVRYVDHLARRPWWLVLLALGWGATGAVAVGAGAGLTLDNVLAQAVSPVFAADWGAALVAPTAEEIAKGAGVVLLLLAARPHLRTVFAGAVYGAIIGVGFAAAEDAIYLLTAADDALPDDVPEALRTVALRIVLPGLVSHPLFTALVGAGVAYGALRRDRTTGRRTALLAGAFALAWIMHAAVNSPLAPYVADQLDRLPGFAPLAGYFLVVWPAAALGAYLLAVLRRRDGARLTRLLTPAAAGAVGGPLFAPATEAEAAVLASRRSRAAAIRTARRAYGVPAAHAVRRLHRAQLRFLEMAPGSAPPVRRARADLAATRIRLYGLTGSAEPPAPAAAAAAAPSWLVPAGLTLSLLGLVHWAPALVAVLLAVVGRLRWRPPARALGIVAVAAAASGYVWATGAFLLLLYPDGL